MLIDPWDLPVDPPPASALKAKWLAWTWASSGGSSLPARDMKLGHALNALTLVMDPDNPARLPSIFHYEEGRGWAVLPLAHHLARTLRSKPLAELWEAEDVRRRGRLEGKARCHRWLRAMALLPEFEEEGRVLWDNLLREDPLPGAFLLDHSTFCQKWGGLMREVMNPEVLPLEDPPFLGRGARP